MNITSSYSMLLGRPWIHSAGAIPSSLHQKVKFVVDGKLITISGEEPLLVTAAPTVPYIEPNEEATSSSLQVFEIAATSYVPEFSTIPYPTISKASTMMAKQMLKDCFEVGKGLGIHLQGIREPLEVTENKGTFGLGYKPSWKDYDRVREEKKERRLAKLQNREPKIPRLEIPHIRVTFPRPAHTVGSAGYLIPLIQLTPTMIAESLSNMSINSVESGWAIELAIGPVKGMVDIGIEKFKAIEEEQDELVAMIQVEESHETTTEGQSWVYPMPENASLTNWKEELLPVVFTKM